MSGFLTPLNDPSRIVRQFVTYDAANCTIVTASGEVIARDGDTFELDIAALRWRYISTLPVEGVSPPKFQPIPGNDPNKIPAIKPGQEFEVAVSMETFAASFILSARTRLAKAGLHTLHTLAGSSSAPVPVTLRRGEAVTWTTAQGEVRTDYPPTFEIVSKTAPKPVPEIVPETVFTPTPEATPEIVAEPEVVPVPVPVRAKRTYTIMSPAEMLARLIARNPEYAELDNPFLNGLRREIAEEAAQ